MLSVGGGRRTILAGGANDPQRVGGPKQRVVVIVAWVAGGEVAFSGQLRRRAGADVHHRRVVRRVLAGDEVVDEIAIPPDLEGIEPVLAVVALVVASPAVVGGEQHDWTAGGEVRDLGVVDPGATGPRADRSFDRDRVLRVFGNCGRKVFVHGRVVVEAELVAAVVEHEHSPALGRRGRAACAPDCHGLVERRKRNHRLDLVGVRRRSVAGDEAGAARPLDVLDLRVAGRYPLPRREHICRGHCRESQNNAIREFLHIITPFHLIAPLVHSKPCQSPMSKFQARQQDLGHWTLDDEFKFSFRAGGKPINSTPPHRSIYTYGFHVLYDTTPRRICQPPRLSARRREWGQ